MNITYPIPINDIEFKVIRKGGFGSWPEYELTIHGSGQVDYLGISNVNVIGKQIQSIDKTQILNLFKNAIDLGIFELDSTYIVENKYVIQNDCIECVTSELASLPSVAIEIRIGQEIKRIFCYEYAPKRFYDFLKVLDILSGANIWIGTGYYIRENDIALYFNNSESHILPHISYNVNDINQKINWLRDSLDRPKPIIDDIEWIWCLVGNIVDEHPYGDEPIIKHGTKQFAPNTKVYCFPPQWDNGYKRFEVIGKSRKRDTLITIILRSERIENFRLAHVYDPFVITKMLTSNGWDNSDNSKQRIEQLLLHLPNKISDSE
jgi:hypothetical protein